MPTSKARATTAVPPRTSSAAPLLATEEENQLRLLLPSRRSVSKFDHSAVVAIEEAPHAPLCLRVGPGLAEPRVVAENAHAQSAEVFSNLLYVDLKVRAHLHNGAR